MHRCTYNIPYDLPSEAKAKLASLFEMLPHFRGLDEVGCPYWFGSQGEAKHLWASIEPSGLLLEGSISDEEWIAWDVAFRQAASQILGFAVRDADE